MFRILLVEDDPEISGVLERQLTAWNYQVGLIRDFRDVLGDFRTFQPHLVLLDIGLPYRNGYHWCEEIRKISKVPILFLSSASDNLNIIMAVNLGGDDFLAKPFDLNVLLAKVQALLRRAYDFGAPEPALEYRGAILDPAAAALLYGGRRLSLTKNECRILQTLLEQKGKIVSRETLMQRLWETDSYVDENALTVNVARLRRKLEGRAWRISSPPRRAWATGSGNRRRIWDFEPISGTGGGAGCWPWDFWRCFSWCCCCSACPFWQWAMGRFCAASSIWGRAFGTLSSGAAATTGCKTWSRRC